MNQIIFFLVIFFPLIIKSESINNESKVDSIIQSGINYLYNYNFDKSITFLDSSTKIDPLHPVPLFVLISAKWLKTQTESGYIESYEKINSEVDKTIPLYREMIKVSPENPELYLYLGSTYGLRARTAMADKDWLDVLFYGYQGYKYIQMSKNMDNHLLDVYMPIGLMEYFTCLSSKTIQLGAKLFGISSDCKQGLYNLEIAAKSSKYSWVEASNVLSYAYLHIERDFDKASEFINPLVENFPGHPFFSFLKGELLAKTQNWDELNKIMPKLENFSKSNSYYQNNESKLKLAYIVAIREFHHNNYTNSIKNINWIISNYDMEFDWLKGFSYILRAKNYEKLKRNDLAVNDYKETLKMDKFYPEFNEARIRLIELGKQ